MYILAIWDSFTKNPPVLSAGFDEQSALSNHPLKGELAADEKGQYHVNQVVTTAVNF